MQTLYSENVINKALALKTWKRKLDANHYSVMAASLRDTKSRDHGRYILTFNYGVEGWPEIVDCSEERTGEQCPGFRFQDGNCFHSASLTIHLLGRRFKDVRQTVIELLRAA